VTPARCASTRGPDGHVEVTTRNWLKDTALSNVLAPGSALTGFPAASVSVGCAMLKVARRKRLVEVTEVVGEEGREIGAQGITRIPCPNVRPKRFG
jgi:hypothetical protein